MSDAYENDFGVVLRPILDKDEDDPSYGNVEVAVFSNLMPELDDELHAQYMFLAYKMAAVLSLCEEHPEFDDMLTDHTAYIVAQLDDMDEGEERALSTKSKITSKMGNVISLNFNTVCEGEG